MKKLINGFTLIEMLTVLAITSFLAGTLILYSRRSESQIIVYKERAQLVSVLSRAKTLAVSGFLEGGISAIATAPCGYGVHFEQDQKTYFLFKDNLGQDGLCDNRYTDLSAGGQDEKTDSFEMRVPVIFDPLTINDIVFVPPIPQVIINGDANILSGEINLRVSGTSDVSKVRVTNTGQITTVTQ